MEERFEVRLCDSRLAFSLAMMGFILALICVNPILDLHVTVWFEGLLFAALAASCVGSYLLIKWLVTHKAIVSVWPDRIEVLHLNSRKTTCIPFAEVKTYSYESLRDRYELIFRTENGPRRKISANNNFGYRGDFAGLLQALERAVEQYKYLNLGAMPRRKTFFEKPASTIILIAVTVVIGWMLGGMLLGKYPLQANVLVLIGCYMGYLGTWLTAAERRNQTLT